MFHCQARIKKLEEKLTGERNWKMDLNSKAKREGCLEITCRLNNG